jgi:hypothetical protein
LLAVTWEGGRSRDVGGETSSTGEIRPAVAAALASTEALFLPKLSFHFDCFFVTGGRVEVTGGVAAGINAAGEGEGWVLLRSALGTAYIEGGS